MHVPVGYTGPGYRVMGLRRDDGDTDICGNVSRVDEGSIHHLRGSCDLKDTG